MLFWLLFEVMKKIIPVVRVFIWILITLIVWILIFALCTIFLLIASSWVWLDVDAITFEIFEQIKSMPNYFLIFWSAFNIMFIPLFLALTGWIYLIFKRKMMWVNVFVVLFVFWIASLSFLTVNVEKNTDIIENIAEKFWEHVVNDLENFHILIDIEK